MTRPAVANMVPINMTRPDSPSRPSLFAVAAPVAFSGGHPIVGLGAGHTLAGQPFTATLVSTITKVQGLPVVLQGATVVTPDGYQGTVGPEHCSSLDVNVG